jgi:hypothetical protein
MCKTCWDGVLVHLRTPIVSVCFVMPTINQPGMLLLGKVYGVLCLAEQPNGLETSCATVVF